MLHLQLAQILLKFQQQTWLQCTYFLHISGHFQIMISLNMHTMNLKSSGKAKHDRITICYMEAPYEHSSTNVN
jgi:hypothetical protein